MLHTYYYTDKVLHAYYYTGKVLHTYHSTDMMLHLSIYLDISASSVHSKMLLEPQKKS
jgi:hypothetical protein